MMKLDPESVSLGQLRQLWTGAEARLDDASLQRVADAAASVDRIVAGGETVYGVNTGFGLLANTRIPDDRLAELQTNLILSHSAGPRRPAAAPRHAADDRAQAARPRPRLFGRPPAGDRSASGACSTTTPCR